MMFSRVESGIVMSLIECFAGGGYPTNGASVTPTVNGHDKIISGHPYPLGGAEEYARRPLKLESLRPVSPKTRKKKKKRGSLDPV